MRQRLGIAAALLGDPDVLILDEPANGLDPEGIRWMRDLLKSLAEQGRTVLVSSHLLSEMEILADDVVIVAAGKLVRQGTVSEIIDSMGTTRVRVRTSRPDDLVAALGSSVHATPTADGALLFAGVDGQTIGDAALAAGVPIYELATDRPDLENVFLQLTAGKADIR
jgi:ABC-2 type transport system ATP-binding protein